jgi:hypothetical protein
MKNVPREQEKVVIMHPNQVTRLVDLDYPTSKGGVGGLVLGVVLIGGGGLSRDILPEEIMEHRPES